MISYESSLTELEALISELGKVYTSTIPGSSQLLEEVETSYDKLFAEYQVVQDFFLRTFKKMLLAYYPLQFKYLFMKSAVSEGSLEVLRALRDGSLGGVCPWDERATTVAAMKGHLEVLRVLRDGSLGGVCPWNEWATTYAAMNGHLEVLRALRDGSLGRVCPWDEWATTYAAENGHLEVLRALRNGSLGGVCPWNKTRCRDNARNYLLMLDLIDSGELD